MSPNFPLNHKVNIIGKTNYIDFITSRNDCQLIRSSWLASIIQMTSIFEERRVGGI